MSEEKKFPPYIDAGYSNEERALRDFKDIRRSIKLMPEIVEKLRKIKEIEKLNDYEETILFLIKIWEFWRRYDL